jgi:N-acylglucosamine 2-epimerase
MKLWWVHLETMIATLMAFKATGNTKHWNQFVQIADYSFQHVSIYDRN